MTYRWEQHYGIDRFDLSGPKAFPMGGLGMDLQMRRQPRLDQCLHRHP